MMIPDPEHPKQQAIDTNTGELLSGVWMAKIGTPAPSLADLDSAGWTHMGYGKINYVEEEPDQEDLAALRSWSTQPRTVTVTGNLVLPRSRDDDHE